MTLEIITHENWVALVNASLQHDAALLDLNELEQFGDGWIADFFARINCSQLKRFIFAATPLLSSYLWTLNVGSYIIT